MRCRHGNAAWSTQKGDTTIPQATGASKPPGARSRGSPTATSFGMRSTTTRGVEFLGHANTYGKGATRLSFQVDGNIVIYRGTTPYGRSVRHPTAGQPPSSSGRSGPLRARPWHEWPLHVAHYQINPDINPLHLKTICLTELPRGGNFGNAFVRKQEVGEAPEFRLRCRLCGCIGYTVGNC